MCKIIWSLALGVALLCGCERREQTPPKSPDVVDSRDFTAVSDLATLIFEAGCGSEGALVRLKVLENEGVFPQSTELQTAEAKDGHYRLRLSSPSVKLFSDRLWFQKVPGQRVQDLPEIQGGWHTLWLNPSTRTMQMAYKDETGGNDLLNVHKGIVQAFAWVPNVPVQGPSTSFPGDLPAVSEIARLMIDAGSDDAAALARLKALDGEGFFPRASGCQVVEGKDGHLKFYLTVSAEKRFSEAFWWDKFKGQRVQDLPQIQSGWRALTLDLATSTLEFAYADHTGGSITIIARKGIVQEVDWQTEPVPLPNPGL